MVTGRYIKSITQRFQVNGKNLFCDFRYGELQKIVEALACVHE